MPELTPFSALLTPAAASSGRLEFTLTDDWMQGRSAFGGAQAALAVAAMRKLTGVDAPLRVLQMSYLAPLPAGTVTVRAEPLRAGKSVTQIEARIESAQGVAAVFVGVFGAARDSAITVPMDEPSLPEHPAEALPNVPRMPGAPKFLQHYAMRWAAGGTPFSGTATTDTRIWLRPGDRAPADQYGDHADELTLVALADVVPTPALSTMKVPAPASTLTWSLEFLRPAGGDFSRFWRIDSHIHAAAGGYVAQTAIVCDPDNRPIALSQQSVVIFG